MSFFNFRATVKQEQWLHKRSWWVLLWYYRAPSENSHQLVKKNWRWNASEGCCNSRQLWTSLNARGDGTLGAVPSAVSRLRNEYWKQLESGLVNHMNALSWNGDWYWKYNVRVAANKFWFNNRRTRQWRKAGNYPLQNLESSLKILSQNLLTVSGKLSSDPLKVLVFHTNQNNNLK